MTKEQILTLLPEGHHTLKTCVPLLNLETWNKEDIKQLSDDMHETRLKYQAIGLAANQCGIPIRMFVIGTAYAQMTCINPEIVTISKEEVVEREGCLSFPGLVLKVRRAKAINVRYYDTDFNLVESELTGIFAKCFQHELDHLNGITFDSRVSGLVLEMAKKKRQKRKR